MKKDPSPRLPARRNTDASPRKAGAKGKSRPSITDDILTITDDILTLTSIRTRRWEKQETAMLGEGHRGFKMFGGHRDCDGGVAGEKGGIQ